MPTTSTGNTSSARTAISLAILVLFGTGCSQVFTVTGYATADPVGVGCKRWPAGTLRLGCAIPGYLGKDCDTQVSAWCNPNGDWGIVDRIQNEADPHRFQTGIELGHVDDRDFRTYVVIATHATDFVTVGKGEERFTGATGTGDPQIAANYERINFARPVVTIDDSIGLPISIRTTNSVSASPPQPAR